ncbi:MAG: hypothetical protein ACI8Y7_000080 [Candidatus Woesearchaeota archaeon]|jgi:hypothetical protein
MKTFLSAHARIIGAPDQSASDLQVLLIPFLPGVEKAPFEMDSFTDSQDETHCIGNLAMQKSVHIRLFAKTLFSRMSDSEFDSLLRDIKIHIDDDCKFFIRFTVDSLSSDTLKVTQSGNCMHCTFAVASFPKRKSIAVELVKTFLNDIRNTR